MDGKIIGGEPFTFEDKKISIVGTGDIGIEIIRLIKEKGTGLVGKVYAGDYSEDNLARVKKIFSNTQSHRAEQLFGEKVFVKKVDVSDDASREEWFEWVKNSGDRIDMFIYTAGMVGPTGVKEFPSYEEIVKTFQVNCLSAIYFVNRFAQEIFIPQRFGRVATIGSMAGYIPTVTAMTYDATKAGLNAWMESFAKKMIILREKEGIDIRSNNFAFRMVESAMTSGMNDKVKTREFERFHQEEEGFITTEEAASTVIRAFENDDHGSVPDGTGFNMQVALAAMRMSIPNFERNIRAIV